MYKFRKGDIVARKDYPQYYHLVIKNTRQWRGFRKRSFIQLCDLIRYEKRIETYINQDQFILVTDILRESCKLVKRCKDL